MRNNAVLIAAAIALLSPASHAGVPSPGRHGVEFQVAADTQADVHGKGMVNSVDAAGHKLNISHQAISALGWPAMKMDFKVAPSVDLSAVKPGTPIDFTLTKDKAGGYEIQSVQPISK